MPKAIDLTGQRYGLLTVIEKTDKRDNSGSIIWLCGCDCGGLKETSAHQLRSGYTRSCNCLKSRIKDLTGQTFGKLTVLESTKERTSSREVVWECQCSCGNKTFATGKSLQSGDKKSCGCLISAGEDAICQELLLNGINFIRQYQFEDLLSDLGVCLRFDFAVLNESGELSHLIEFDGQQHFYYLDNGWNNKECYEKVTYHDSLKNNYCKKNNIKLVRIKYDEEITIDKLL